MANNLTYSAGAGVLFAALWSSASVATKIGLLSGQPFLIANIRFFLAGALMLLWAHGWRRYRLPQAQEWKSLAIYGLFNVTIYLGAFVLAMREVAAGIGTLSLALHPLLIGVFSALWRRRRIRQNEWLGLLLGLSGVALATWPLLLNSYASLSGILFLVASMLSYAIGTVYYSGVRWEMPILSINGWQVLFGGLLLLPVTLLFTDFGANRWDVYFWGSVWWLVLPVSIGAVQLWLYLLKNDPLKAALWLYLCPVFGFLYASVLLDEPLTWHTLLGAVLVIGGLYWGQKQHSQN